MMENIAAREADRKKTERSVICRIYASSDAFSPMEGVLRNCSADGAYIESRHAFKPGVVLLVELDSSRAKNDECADKNGHPLPRCLMEVKWCRQLEDEPSLKFGMGLRHLEMYT